MSERFFKFRGSTALHAAVLAQAGREGLRVGTYLREVVERELKRKTGVVVEKKAAALDHDTQRLLQEQRLLLREIAMNSNAQIMPRVAAQLRAFDPKTD